MAELPCGWYSPGLMQIVIHPVRTVVTVAVLSAALFSHLSVRAPQAVASASPGLSISVTDGRKTVRPGDRVSYTVKLHNIGTTTAPGLVVVQTLPAGLTLVSATPHAVTRAGQVRWKISLPPGRARTFGVVGQVEHTSKQLLRLATVACATADGGTKPIVCAAHSDQLPAGAAAADPRRGTGGRGTAWYVVLAAVAVAGFAAVAGWRLAVRRRARRVTENAG